VRVKNKPAAPATADLAPGLRRYLYLTAAITGGAIMIVEILGAKMLSPYLGTSHFVWTAQIAITLVALACGYYAGGWLVDRALRPGRMYAGILAAGVYLALCVPFVEGVAYGCLRFELAVGSLLASTFLFFIPLSLLAMVGPFFIRVLTSSVSGMGGNVGRLSAISTLGSFAGTVLIGYVLIPFLPNSVTMYFTALLLMSVAVVYFLSWGRRAGGQVPAAVTLLCAGALGYAGVRADKWRNAFSIELFRGNSNFGLLQVLQQKDGPHRYYLNDYLVQNTYDTNEQKSISMFTYMLRDLARAYAPKVEEALCIGMGVGIVPMDLARDGAQVDVVEINPAVVPVAEKFFNFDRSKVNVRIGDGRYFVNQSTKQYDAVILDAFLGDSCPSHLMTRETFSSIRRILKPEGVLVINTFADPDLQVDFFSASLYKTLTSAFTSVRLHHGRNGNSLFVASARPSLAILHPPDHRHVYAGVREQVRDAFNRIREPNLEHGRVLTDDYNPVEFYDAANRESLRKNLALSARSR
jgi:predicted membrane-bound spermidine synthase